MGWVKPTGFVDPDSKWADEADAYDSVTSTYAFNDSPNYGYYLELTISEINCDKVRIYAADHTIFLLDPDLDIDVYYEGAWHNIWSGVITKRTWIEKSIPAGTKPVSKARVKSNTSTRDLLLYEFDFWEVEADVTVEPPNVGVDSDGKVPTHSLGLVLLPPLVASDSEGKTPTLALDGILQAPNVEIG